MGTPSLQVCSPKERPDLYEVTHILLHSHGALSFHQTLIPFPQP